MALKKKTFVRSGSKKRGRYGADKRIKTDTGIWDSQDEYRRFLFLEDLEKKGTIQALESKVKYDFVYNGVKIASFKPDFRYKVGDALVVEDYKGGVIPRDFKLRCKMLQAFYGIECVIVQNPTDIRPITNAGVR